MIDGIYDFDNEVITTFADQCSKVMIEDRSIECYQISKDTGDDHYLVKYSLCKLDENSLEDKKLRTILIPKFILF